MGVGFGWVGLGYEILEERKGVVFGVVNGLCWFDRVGFFRIEVWILVFLICWMCGWSF